MKSYTLGKTNITVPKNAFGALPIQRVEMDLAVNILRKAYDGGMRFFDTARAYTDSEEKLGNAFYGMRDKIIIASKTMAKNVDDFWHDLNTSLALLKTDYIDIYQFHCVNQVYRPNDGTGMYEAMLEAKAKGMIKHIGITAHKVGIAEEIIESDLYETLQFPFSYISSQRDINLVKACKDHNMGFIAMKGLSGGLLTNSKACMAFMNEYDVLPIWGIQSEKELDEWLSFFNDDAILDDSIKAIIDNDIKELSGDFCRGCGYCMPCPQGIIINQCARMSQMVRRAPKDGWVNEKWTLEMKKIETCLNCGKCMKHCPYELNIPTLLKKNLEDYNNILSGKTKI